jgi:hypothetical protein
VWPNFFASGLIFGGIWPKTFGKSWQHWKYMLLQAEANSTQMTYYNSSSYNTPCLTYEEFCDSFQLVSTGKQKIINA